MQGTFEIGCVDVFEMGSRKESAVKVLEEAAELFSVWERRFKEGTPSADFELSSALEELEDEAADVIQATCNLLARYGVTAE